MRTLTPDSPMSCEEAVRSLWDHIDRRVEPESLAAIEDHLARCDDCRAHAEFEARLVKSLSELRGRYSDVVRLRENVLKVLRAAGMGAGKDP